MNRRNILKLFGLGALAGAVPAAATASYVRPEMLVWTYVQITETTGLGSPDFPFTTSGYVMHKPDLSDLDEPYLSAVKRARAKNTHSS